MPTIFECYSRLTCYQLQLSQQPAIAQLVEPSDLTSYLPSVPYGDKVLSRPPLRAIVFVDASKCDAAIKEGLRFMNRIIKCRNVTLAQCPPDATDVRLLKIIPLLIALPPDRHAPRAQALTTLASARTRTENTNAADAGSQRCFSRLRKGA